MNYGENLVEFSVIYSHCLVFWH